MNKNIGPINYRNILKGVCQSYPESIQDKLRILLSCLETPGVIQRDRIKAKTICRLLQEAHVDFNLLFDSCARGMDMATLIEDSPESKNRLRRPFENTERKKKTLAKLVLSITKTHDPDLTVHKAIRQNKKLDKQIDKLSDGIIGNLIKNSSTKSLNIDDWAGPNNKSLLPSANTMDTMESYWDCLQAMDRKTPVQFRQITRILAFKIKPSDIRGYFLKHFIAIIPKKIKYHREIIWFLMGHLFGGYASLHDAKAFDKAVAYDKKRKPNRQMQKQLRILTNLEIPRRKTAKSKRIV